MNVCLSSEFWMGWKRQSILLHMEMKSQSKSSFNGDLKDLKMKPYPLTFYLDLIVPWKYSLSNICDKTSTESCGHIILMNFTTWIILHKIQDSRYVYSEQ